MLLTEYFSGAVMDSPAALNAAVEREALEQLQKIFVTKQLPEKEQKLWFRQILEETGLNYDYKEFI